MFKKNFREECSSKSGTNDGSCASGFGVCCLFTKNCGAMTNQNNSLFQNNGFPSTYDSVGSCQLTVNKCDSGVCQLRLNFVLHEDDQLQCKFLALLIPNLLTYP